MTFAPMKQEKAAQQIAKRVRSAIVSGELKIGDRLPPERELIQITGFSRAVVREGLRVLEADGLIALHAGRNGGAIIERPDTDRLASTLDVLLSIESVGVEEINEVLAILETQVIELAIERISAKDIEGLRRTITIIKENPEDADLVRVESNRFHVLLAEATRNRMLAMLSRLVHQIVIRMSFETKRTQSLQIAKIHGQILDAIVEKDVVAAKRRALRHLSACKHSMTENARGESAVLSDKNSRLATALAETPRRRDDA